MQMCVLIYTGSQAGTRKCTAVPQVPRDPAPHCSPLLPATPHCSPLLPTAPYSSPLLLTAPHCTPLLPTAPHCSPLLPSAPTDPHCSPLFLTAPGGTLSGALGWRLRSRASIAACARGLASLID